MKDALCLQTKKKHNQQGFVGTSPPKCPNPVVWHRECVRLDIRPLRFWIGAGMAQGHGLHNQGHPPAGFQHRLAIMGRDALDVMALKKGDLRPEVRPLAGEPIAGPSSRGCGHIGAESAILARSAHRQAAGRQSQAAPSDPTTRPSEAFAGDHMGADRDQIGIPKIPARRGR
jgi:hypothetical protein